MTTLLEPVASLQSKVSNDDPDPTHLRKLLSNVQKRLFAMNALLLRTVWNGCNYVPQFEIQTTLATRTVEHPTGDTGSTRKENGNGTSLAKRYV